MYILYKHKRDLLQGLYPMVQNKTNIDCLQGLNPRSQKTKHKRDPIQGLYPLVLNQKQKHALQGLFPLVAKNHKNDCLQGLIPLVTNKKQIDSLQGVSSMVANANYISQSVAWYISTTNKPYVHSHLFSSFMCILSHISRFFIMLLNAKSIMLIMLISIHVTSTYAHDLHPISVMETTPHPLHPGLHNCPLYFPDCLSMTYLNAHNSDIRCTGTNFFHVSQISEYQIHCTVYDSYTHREGYDYKVLLQGPFDTQKFPNIVELSIYVQQNMMLKHDFLNYVHFLTYLKPQPVSDIYHGQFYLRQLQKKHCKPNIVDEQNLTSILGGGPSRVTHCKEEVYTSACGSSYFGGNILSQYPCFTLNNSELLCIQQPELFASATYQLLHILPKQSVHTFSSQVDLVCCIPITNILSRLTKSALSSLPYVSKKCWCLRIFQENPSLLTLKAISPNILQKTCILFLKYINNLEKSSPIKIKI